MTRQVVVTIPQAAPWLSTNDRSHWRVRNDRTQAWREAAGWAARRGPHQLEPIAGPFRVHATIHKTTHQVWDLDGITPTVKACIDGLRDAGVIADDNRRLMRGFSLADGGPEPTGSVVLTITPIVLNPPRSER